MSKKTKMDRKELKKPDEFVTKGRAMLDFMNQKRKRFLPVLIGGVLLVVSVYGFDWWSTKKLNEGWAAYYEVNKLENDTKWTELEKIYSNWSGVRPAYFAALGLADHYFSEAEKALYGVTPEPEKKADKKDDKKEEAEKVAATQPDKEKSVELGRKSVTWYSKALDFGELMSSERQLIYINRGNAHELAGEIDKALEDYQTAVDFGGDPKPLAMLNLARAQRLSGNEELAKATYTSITVDFPGSEYSKVAKQRLRRLTSPLFAGRKRLGSK